MDVGGKEGGKDSGGGGCGCGQKRFRGDQAYIKNRVNAACSIDPNDKFFIHQECKWCSSDSETYYLTVNCAADKVLHTSERKSRPKTKKIASQGMVGCPLCCICGWCQDRVNNLSFTLREGGDKKSFAARY